MVLATYSPCYLCCSLPSVMSSCLSSIKATVFVSVLSSVQVSLSVKVENIPSFSAKSALQPQLQLYILQNLQL